MNRLVLIVTLTICANIQHVLSVEYSPIVQLTNGKVRGLLKDVKPSGDKVYFYEGIRYGHGERFSAPKPVGPWTDVYDATNPRDSCPQAANLTISEDCLYLSIWRPVKDSTKPRQVMVFIHGGGYNSGTIFTSDIDGINIASQGDVIVVTINYRLGAFGFLFGGTKDAPGNVGLRDQILAIQWVKDNIGHFGGDPNTLTVFGESAGSFSVGSLILSPLAKGLFIRAIMQSGAPNSPGVRSNQSVALQLTQQLAHSVGCTSETVQTSINCLRQNKTIKEIASLPINTMFFPIYGDEVLPIRPEIALKTGKFNKELDLMYGITSNEGSIFVEFKLLKMRKFGENVTLELAEHALRDTFNNASYLPEIVAFYKLTNNSTQEQLKAAVGRAYGDGYLSCPTILFGEHYSKHISPHHTVYSYRLTRETLTHLPLCTGWMSVCHGEDMSYLFIVPTIESNPKLLQLSHDMIRAWTEFAKTGKPTKMGNVEWSPAYDQNMVHNQHMNLDPDDYKMVNDFYKETCDAFWKPKIE